MTQAGLLCSRSPRERHSNRANGTNYDHLMDRSANSPRRSKAFVNAVTWLDPRACGPNERMWRVKMAWVWVAPCLFVAFALPGRGACLQIKFCGFCVAYLKIPFATTSAIEM